MRSIGRNRGLRRDSNAGGHEWPGMLRCNMSAAGAYTPGETPQICALCKGRPRGMQKRGPKSWFRFADSMAYRRFGTSDGNLRADLDHATGRNLEKVRRVARRAGQRNEQPILPARHSRMRRWLERAARQEERRRHD